MVIEEVVEATEELLDALERLIPQLSAHKSAPTLDELTKLVNSESSTLLIARVPDEKSAIVGMLTLAIYRVPTGIRSIIEDVVVDETMRRRGIAEALLKRAMELAREASWGGWSGAYFKFPASGGESVISIHGLQAPRDECVFL